MAKPSIIPGAEPFFFPGNRTGCLLVHGLTGTPKEMRWMSEFLCAQGYTVLCPRLAGHATCPGDLARTHWCDWIASLEDGFHMLSICCDRVFIIGLSLGGVLTLTAASYLPAAGIVTMSTPYDLPADWRLKFIGILKLVMPRVAKSAANWQDLTAASDHIEYPYHLTAAIAQLRDLLAIMRSTLPSVRMPALVVHSRLDRDVSPANAQTIYDQLGSPQKELLWVEHSSHNIPRDADRQIAFEAAHRFIQRCLAPNAEQALAFQ